MTLDEARERIGRYVRYTETGETGVIASVGEKFVFVRYGGLGGSMGTKAEDLELVG